MRRIVTLVSVVWLAACHRDPAPAPSAPVAAPAPPPSAPVAAPAPASPDPAPTLATPSAPPSTPVLTGPVFPSAPPPPPGTPALDSLVTDLAASQHLHLVYHFAGLSVQPFVDYDVDCELSGSARCTYYCGPRSDQETGTEVRIDASDISAALAELGRDPLYDPPPPPFPIEAYIHASADITTPTTTVHVTDHEVTVGSTTAPFGGVGRVQTAVREALDRICDRTAPVRR